MAARLGSGSAARGAWEVPGDVACAAADVVSTVITAVYVVGSALKAGSFHGYLRHPLFGPLTAHTPVIGILLAARFELDFTCWGASRVDGARDLHGRHPHDLAGILRGCGRWLSHRSPRPAHG